jgi:hypothetical protein
MAAMVARGLRAVRGMPDYLAEEAARLRAVEDVGLRLAARAGYREVRRTHATQRPRLALTRPCVCVCVCVCVCLCVCVCVCV